MGRKLNIVFYALLLVIILPQVAAHFLQQPVLFSYTYSDSMEPTIHRWDGFFIQHFPGIIRVGDIIVYGSSTGDYRAHRVFAKTPDGFITKGDHNAFTDQQANEPIVTPESILGTVLCFGGRPVVIPMIGYLSRTLSIFVKKYQLEVACATGVLGAALILLDKSKPKRRRRAKKTKRRLRVKHLFIIASVLLIASISVMCRESSLEIEYVTTKGAREGERAGYPGEVLKRDYELVNEGLIPFYFFLSTDSGNVKLTQSVFLLGSKSATETKIFVRAEEEIGLHHEKIRIWRLLPLLPASVLGGMLGVNPYLPLITLNATVLAPFILIYLTIGEGNRLVTLRSRWISRTGRRLRRFKP